MGPCFGDSNSRPGLRIRLPASLRSAIRWMAVAFGVPWKINKSGIKTKRIPDLNRFIDTLANPDMCDWIEG